MQITFLNPKKKLGDNIDTEKVQSPYNTSQKWAIESFFIDIYFLLAHRIKGLGWTLKDFMECDTWTTSKLYCMECDVIEEEEQGIKGDSEEIHDSEEMKDLYAEMYGA